MTEQDAITDLKRKLEERYETTKEQAKDGYWSIVNCNIWEKYGKKRLYVEVWEGRKKHYKEWKHKNNIAVVDLQNKKIIECDEDNDLIEGFIANL